MKITSFLKKGLLSLCFVPLSGNAQTASYLRLPSLFTDHIVLQQQSRVAIWGWAQAATQVRLVGSWNVKDTIQAVANDYGKWKAEIPTGKYGGPYTLQVIGHANRIELKDVMLGEVWLCSGQSNMEWSINNGVDNKKEEIAAAFYPQVRYFSLPKQGSEYPQDDVQAKWEICTPDVMRRRSALAYFFAEKLHKDLKVPVGVIVSAWGGTPAEVWLPAEKVRQNNVLKKAMPNNPRPWWPVTPGRLYNSMIHPLQPYTVKGALWYQGESNRERPATYSVLMQELVKSWREGFCQPLPFYIVQIAPYRYGANDNGPALVREAQYDVTQKLADTHIIGTNDIGDLNNIHPSKKRQVGERSARLTMKYEYGRTLEGVDNPVYQSMCIDKKKVILFFRNIAGQWQCPDKEIVGFSIAGNDRRFVPAKVKIKGNTLILKSSEVKAPVAVRYCFDEAGVGNVFSPQGLPLLPFRTDTW